MAARRNQSAGGGAQGAEGRALSAAGRGQSVEASGQNAGRKKPRALGRAQRAEPSLPPVSARRAPSAPVASPEVEQLLTFLIGEDEYGISILRVREIAEYRELTPVPMTPSWMRGVMNLRGMVVPVVDLAGKLGLAQTRVSRRTCLVIAEMDAGDEVIVIAVMVDGVSRVVDVPRTAIQEPPPFGLDIDFVPGLVRIEETLVVLLDLTAILATSGLLDAASLLPILRDDGAEGDRAHQ